MALPYGEGFQVINGQAYVAGLTEGFQTRLLSVQRMLLAVSRRWQLPDVDMVIEQDDFPTVGPVSRQCPRRGPIIAATKHGGNPRHRHVILAPDWSFAEWVETGAMSWGEMLGILDTANTAHPWEERTPSLLFRGAPTGATRPALASDLRCMRCCEDGLQGVADAAPTDATPTLDVVIDAHIHGPGMYKSLYQHCAHKYLLQLPGRSFSARLKYLLACSSAVVWLGEEGAEGLRAIHQEFWYHLLQDMEHVLFVPTQRGRSMAALLAAAAQWLQEHDAAAQRMGRAARELLRKALTPDLVLEYWRRLIVQYAALQDFRPTVHEDAVPLEESLVSKRTMRHQDRTCPRCTPSLVGK